MTPDQQGPAPVDVELAREVRRVNDPHLQPNHEALRSDGWPKPSSDWILDQAAKLSSSKSEDAVGALAWNLTVAFTRWIAALPDPLVVLEGIEDDKSQRVLIRGRSAVPGEPGLGRVGDHD